MENDFRGSENHLLVLYPLLGPGVLCQHRGQVLQWAGFPLLRHPGHIAFEGRYAVRVIQRGSAWVNWDTGSTAFSGLRTCHHRSEPLDSVLQERIHKGFDVIEDSITLEAMVQRGDLRPRQLLLHSVRAEFKKMLEDLRFGRLTTEHLIRDAPWC
ncbi:hypothetical protein [Acidithiobacillus caldus]|uniref:Uncharacterized protein n=2 Tax=Acidithiobacillus caldus TaxID=33059 RepID=F9ZKX2_ACICS|nr:hypothetical protein [Acidithiobacillus caldus]AEK57409.1 hypothetical protein Atc_0760 [Acidithiobacillus caldus SM-1]MBU2763988.1 hypothetical protein [Acidithiobacillus caldus]MBU2769686.1 hypothetical protein [Acidithiobacillus caldus]OFC62636.1 hypothetical protein BAE30_01665 [Acidithiobacillus caldus]